MSPKKGNPDFDKDLKYGLDREDRIVAILDAKKTKAEIKTERDWWYRSGNLCIEIESFGKPSGIMTTKADYWIQIFSDGPDDFCRLIFDTSTVKRLAKKYISTARYGGDYNKSRFVLIPLKELFKRENTKHMRKKDED